MTIQQKLFSFKGRMARLDTFLYILGLAIVHLILNFLSEILILFSQNIGIVFSFSLSIVYLWISLAIGAKRFHDMNMSGWWQVPVYLGMPVSVVSFYIYFFSLNQIGLILSGSLFLLVLVTLICFYVIKGTIGKNKYGLDPLKTEKSNLKTKSIAKVKAKVKPKKSVKKKK